MITGDEALSQIIFPKTYNAKTVLLYNCTLVDVSFHSSELRAGSSLAYLNVQFLPNEYFKALWLKFYEKGNFDYGHLCSPNTLEKDGYDEMNVMYLDELNCTLPWLVGKSK